MFADYPLICLITPGRLSSPGQADDRAQLLTRIAAAAQAGVTLVQIREPHLEARALAAFVRAALGATEGTPAHILVNDRLDVAVAAGAHGVHLKERSMAVAAVRTIAPAPFIVGRSIHDANTQVDGDVDYVLFGTVFESASKPGSSATGLQPLQAAVARVSVPVLAVGGVGEAQIPAVRAAGAAGFAAIGYFDVDPAVIAERCARARHLF
jgi:thiamine-phosphate pyrophosphorylase